MSILQPLMNGGRAALPIVIGYLPVAMAFGAAGTTAGLPPLTTTGISAFVFAGASQFLLLATLTTGSPLPIVVALCAALNLRHLLYGSVLAPRAPRSVPTRLGLAFGLTDEVFAAALASGKSGDGKLRGAWLVGLTGSAYAAWTIGTAFGAYLGAAVEDSVPAAAAAARFALPALFIAITLLHVSRDTRVAMMVAAGVSALFVVIGLPSAGIFLGAGTGLLAALTKQGRW